MPRYTNPEDGDGSGYMSEYGPCAEDDPEFGDGTAYIY